MVGGKDPMDPADEDDFVRVSVEALNIITSLGIDAISSTSFEGWMDWPQSTPGSASWRRLKSDTLTNSKQ